jgi:thiamine-phosphate pyrophosphorylase
MDRKLVGWARAVKARMAKTRNAGLDAGTRGVPVLWLVTDAARLPDPRAAVMRLPKGIAGVVLRHDDDPDREALARDLAGVCRARRLALAIAGDWRLAAALHAGLHLRAGRRPPAAPRRMRAWTSSAHGVADLLRARRAGVALPLLSPVFSTRSHPGAAALGVARWALMAGRAGGAGALGGVSGVNIRRLPPRRCRGAGAIGSLT